MDVKSVLVGIGQREYLVGLPVLQVCVVGDYRAHLDRRVICDLLGFGEDVYQAVRMLAAKWCAEPSVHGGKKRPKGAMLV